MQLSVAEAAVGAFGWRSQDGAMGELGAEEDAASWRLSARRRDDEGPLIAPSREAAIRRVEREVRRREREKNRARQA